MLILLGLIVTAFFFVKAQTTPVAVTAVGAEQSVRQMRSAAGIAFAIMAIATLVVLSAQFLAADEHFLVSTNPVLILVELDLLAVAALYDFRAHLIRNGQPVLSLERVNTMVLGVEILLCSVGAIFWAEKITAAQPDNGVIHVEYWEKWTDFERDAMKQVVDRYNATQGKEKGIYVDFLPASQIEDKTLIAAAGGNPPDISGLTTIDIAPFADDDAIIPLDKLCKRYGIKGSDYVPVYWDEVNYRGQVFGLPTTPASVALHYNTAEFKDAGLDPSKPPQTIEEMDADAAKLTKRNENGTYDRMGFLPGEPGWWNYGWGFFFGGQLWNGKDKITCNSPDNVRAFTWIASYSKKYGKDAITSFKSGLGQFSSPHNGFIEGDVAMEIQGVWMSNFINRFNPKLQWAAAPFPYPADRPDLKDMTIADEDNLVIPRGAKHPNEAFDFMAFVQQQKNMEMLCLLQRKHSPLAKVSPEFIKESPNPYITLFDDLPKMKNVRRPPMMSIWRQYNDELGAAFDAVTLLEKTPQQAMDDVYNRMQPLLDQYNRVMAARKRAGQG